MDNRNEKGTTAQEDEKVRKGLPDSLFLLQSIDCLQKNRIKMDDTKNVAIFALKS